MTPDLTQRDPGPGAAMTEKASASTPDSTVEPSGINRSAVMMGFWAATLASALTLVFVLLALVFDADEWSGMEAYARTFEIIQVAQLVPILLLAPVVVVLIASIHHLTPDSKKVFSHIALIFSGLYAAIIGTNYIIQLSVVRLNVRAGDLEGLDLLAMPNPRSVFVALETAGYAFFSLMALFLGAVFAGERLERWTRRLLIVTGITDISGTVGVLVDERLMMLTGFGLSLLAFLVAAILLGLHFKRLDPGGATDRV
jgi:hypothetical protein